MKKSLMLFLLLWGASKLLSAQSEDKIFYSSFRPEGWDIHLSKDNGRSFQAFTSHPSLDYDAKISPDGNWVVFTSERNGRPQLYVKHIQGESLPRLLVQSASMQDQVDFSPDGKWIAFVSSHEGNADIYRLPFQPSDTLNIAQAENLTQDVGGDFRPAYSHDGRYIAFSSDRDRDTRPHPFFVFAMQRTGDIYRMSADGGEVTRLTQSEDWDGSPSWSKDDAQLYFYGKGAGISTLYRMSSTGADRTALPLDDRSAYSPILTDENSLLFTRENEDERSFSICRLDLESMRIDSSTAQDFDMFNADYHPSGLIVCHGGYRPEETEYNKAGFEGDLLVKNAPESVQLLDRPIDLYGVRRAFVAPPSLDATQLIYDHSPHTSPESWMSPYIFPVIALPLLALFWFFRGIARSILDRKKIPFWKNLLFAFISLLIAVGLGILLFNTYVAFASPIAEIRGIMLTAGLILIAMAVFVRFRSHRKSDRPRSSLLGRYSKMLIGYGIVLLYIAMFCGKFMKVTRDFYAVDIHTHEVEHLFTFTQDEEMNPFLARIIDAKLTPDGEKLQFTVGGFRQDPSAQSALYSYHLEEGTLERLTDLDSNNGFADFSRDENTMVYRSGSSGTLDIYLKEDGKSSSLTQSPARENFPVISQDGNLIAYCSDVSGIDKDGLVKTMDIYITERNSDGTWSEPVQLTDYEGQEAHPHFSPDGKWLIYATEEYGINDEQPLVQPYIFSPQMYGEIAAIRLEDGLTVRLTHNKWEDGAPLWLLRVDS